MWQTMPAPPGQIRGPAIHRSVPVHNQSLWHRALIFMERSAQLGKPALALTIIYKAAVAAVAFRLVVLHRYHRRPATTVKRRSQPLPQLRLEQAIAMSVTATRLIEPGRATLS